MNIHLKFQMMMMMMTLFRCHVIHFIMSSEFSLFFFGKKGLIMNFVVVVVVVDSIFVSFRLFSIFSSFTQIASYLFFHFLFWKINLLEMKKKEIKLIDIVDWLKSITNYKLSIYLFFSLLQCFCFFAPKSKFL